MRPPTKRNAGQAPGASVDTGLQQQCGHRITPLEQPEHGNDRRRFLVWALMLGAVPPERMVERIVAEVEVTR